MPPTRTGPSLTVGMTEISASSSSHRQRDGPGAADVAAERVAVPAAHPEGDVPGVVRVGAEAVGGDGAVHVDVPAGELQRELVGPAVDGPVAGRSLAEVPPLLHD